MNKKDLLFNMLINIDASKNMVTISCTRMAEKLKLH